MGKWTKGFLIAAVVLILFGVVLCIGGAAAGGVYYSNNFAAEIIHDMFDDEDDDWMVDKDGVQINSTHHEETKHYEDEEHHESWYPDTDGNERNYSAQDIRSLEIDIQKAKVELVEEESLEEILVYTDGGKFNIDVKQGVLIVKSDSKLNKNKVLIKIPAGFEFEEVDISAGGASVDISNICVGEIDLECGAGVIEIGNLDAREADFEIGAGEIMISYGSVFDCSVKVGMGDFQYDGIISGECDIECGMGNAELRLEGKEENYNYEIECSAGNVDIGGRSYGGVAFSQTINNHAKANMDIECSMGNVTVEF